MKTKASPSLVPLLDIIIILLFCFMLTTHEISKEETGQLEQRITELTKELETASSAQLETQVDSSLKEEELENTISKAQQVIKNMEAEAQTAAQTIVSQEATIEDLQDTLARTIEAQQSQISKINDLEEQLENAEITDQIIPLEYVDLCNFGLGPESIVFAYYEDNGHTKQWVSEGWYHIQPDECKMLHFPNKENHLYYYALASGTIPN